MKTVLIVEDEKLIRKGIKAMVQRSGVPVEVIIECSNGEAALEILKEQQVDVMFTDIRMPKMDGIELVTQMNTLPNPPLAVAISGFDDFSYAVEMLRNGVREYMLKPVEREKLTEILKKLDKEIENRKTLHQTEKKVGYQQLKFVFSSSSMTKEEMELLEQKYSELLFAKPYVVCVTGKEFVPQESESVIFLEDVEGSNVLIAEADNFEEFLRNELEGSNAGISTVCNGVKEILRAYKEANSMRKRAFCIEKELQFGKEEQNQVPQGLCIQAQKLLGDKSCMQRIQLIGTDKTEELTLQWNKLFEETRREHISPEEFKRVVHLFLEEVGGIYRNALTEEDVQVINECKGMFKHTGISQYEDALMGMILNVHNRINHQIDANRNRQKMKMAVDYIQENYNKDLNMAVVSNYISMNYSLFSFSFKQYTGNNFVNYLKEIRIAKAKELLKDTDIKVIEISRMVGYDNEKNFMKIFKMECGVSPSEYRKNMQRD